MGRRPKYTNNAVTYVVTDMLEWHTFFRAGKVKIPVSFTGGAHTPYGIAGGRFTTDSPLIQRIIEDSDEFKSRRVIRQN